MDKFPSSGELSSLFVSGAMHLAQQDASLFKGDTGKALAASVILDMIKQFNLFSSTEFGKSVPAYVAVEAISNAIVVLSVKDNA